MRFDRHTLVLLVRPPDAPELSDEEAAELQDRHLAVRAGRPGDDVDRPGRERPLRGRPVPRSMAEAEAD